MVIQAKGDRTQVFNLRDLNEATPRNFRGLLAGLAGEISATQQDVADAIEVSQTLMSRWFTGRAKPGTEHVEKLVLYFAERTGRDAARLAGEMQRVWFATPDSIINSKDGTTRIYHQGNSVIIDRESRQVYGQPALIHDKP